LTKTEDIFSRLDIQASLTSEEIKNIDVDLLKKWLQELRDPSNKQARGWLSRRRSKGDVKVGRCCLGLLCSVAGMEERRATAEENLKYRDSPASSDINIFIDDSGKIHWTIPPPALQAAVGIQNISGELVDLNDTAMQPYTVIADYVETYMKRQGVL
jgi:hypothetical protein